MNGVPALTFELMLAGAAGGVLGLLFYGGLWWTVRRAFASQRTAWWVGGSLLLRLASAAAGFVLVSAGDWRRLLACLVGFLAARWFVVRCTARTAAQPAYSAGTATAYDGGKATTDPT